MKKYTDYTVQGVLGAVDIGVDKVNELFIKLAEIPLQ
jgi:hypothetical protein